ncbi:glycosyltransferase [Clostridium sp. 'deep sea']|uniref:glycosyltransferase family 2 protein n=1 Tax=Clostridium sp. 'deep sea' TaxID=2779445 RepID=UPI001896708E|nr:glycosyltransferase family 2 protein [Clostridium sp. 'deep sea']QOR34040.1 glycosyltransferase [Clostridium sp. 'deep sea']
MTDSATLYNIIAVIYIGLFLLFARLFYYRYYTYKRFWKNEPQYSLTEIKDLAKENNKPLPFFSLMIPARNEAAVIAKTLDHITNLTYPKDKYEVIVVTDEKECIQNRIDKQKSIDSIISYFNGSNSLLDIDNYNIKKLLYGLTSYLLLSNKLFYNPLTANSKTRTLVEKDIFTEAALLTEITMLINKSSLYINKYKIFGIIKRYYPNISTTSLNDLLVRYLSLSLPVIETAHRLQGKYQQKRYREGLISRINKVRKQLTREIITELTAAACDSIGTYLTHIQHDNMLPGILHHLYVEILPTTQQVIEKWQQQRVKDLPIVVHKIVPPNFNGDYKGQILDKEVPSTKGRALNYAIPDINPKAAMCGFYDAESRPKLDVLLHVAWRCIKAGENNRILQGPVFQVRNFFSMGPVSRIASLYQSATHNWTLPITFKKIPFVGGTNVYISCDLLFKLRGYDHLTLTEDLEIGTRAWLDFNVWPEYLPCPSSEQTPPNFKAYFRQRLRWGTGHLQVVDKITHDFSASDKKDRLIHSLQIKGPVEWTFYQCISLIPITVWILFMVGLVRPEEAAIELRLLLLLLSTVYFAFTYFCYFQYKPYIDFSSTATTLWSKTLAMLGLLLLPLSALLFPLPFSSALLLKSLDKHPKLWVKTPRTQE